MDKFVYDIFHTIEVPTFVLSNVYHHHIGVINNIDLDSIDIKFNMATAQEVSCDVYKELNGSKCDLWDKIVGLRYVFIPEFKEYYKIDCSLDETNEIVKHLTLTSAGEYELSNKKILSLEINTESDILQDDYITTVFYDENNPRGSLLDRALADKAPDWSIEHVDETLKTIQRTFSVNNQSIYDFLTNTVAKEINCLFLFDSVKREISAYDLLNKCSDCGYRGEMLTTCTKCGSTNLIKGYGKDSNIFISADNYAEKITVDSNEDAVKNCFRVTGGDDYMNATIRNCNPNGSHYIYNFSEADYEDMPPQLTAKLIEYGEKYDELLPEYQEVVADYYDNLNSYYFYKTSMMPRINGTHWEAEKGYDVGDEVYVKTLPSWCYLECIQSGISGTTEFDATRVTVDQEFTDGTVIWQAKKNIISVPSAEQSLNDIKDYFAENDIYFQNNIPTAITEVNNEVKNIAGLSINSIFRIEIILDDYNKVTDGVWTGNIKVYNTGNTEDSITTDEPLRVNVRIAESLPDYMQYMSDKVEKRLSKVDTTFTELFKIEIPRDENYNYIAEDDTQFKEALHEYGLDMLPSFSKSYQGCIETLISNGITDEESSLLAYNLYNPMYVPYYARLGYISDEMAVRQATVDEYEAAYKDAYNKMQEYHKELDMKTFLGDELYKTLYNYIREDEYSNNNYISDGLSDGEVINDAKKLLEIANDELVKANTMQYTLSDTLVNLFNTKEFKDYKDSFRIGDYIICEADERLYRLRLIGVSYSYNSPDKINLTFSNFVALENYFSDAQNILSTAKTMSTSYGAVMHQVDKSADVTDEVSNWKDEGLSSATTTIKNNDNEEVIIDENGILAREYDDVTQTYSDEQMRITHNIIAFTDDAWKTSTLGIGKQAFMYYSNDPADPGWKEDVGYGLNAKFVNSGYITGTQIVAGDIYSNKYEAGHYGSHINLNDGSFDLAGGGLIGRWNNDTHSYDLNYTGDVEGVLDVGVGSHLGTWTVYDDGLYSGVSVLKPDNIYVTGNVRASDFQLGNTLLSSILDKKQAKLNAGTNITLTPEQDGTVTISAAGGGGGLQYFVETPSSLYGKSEVDITVDPVFIFDEQAGLHARFQGGMNTILSMDDGVVIGWYESQCIKELRNDTVWNGIFLITDDINKARLYYKFEKEYWWDVDSEGVMTYQNAPNASLYPCTSNLSMYGFSSSVEIEGTTYYLLIIASNWFPISDVKQRDDRKQLSSCLNYMNPYQYGTYTETDPEHGYYKTFADWTRTILGASLVEYYNGLSRSGKLAFFAGGEDSNGTNAPIKIFADGTTEGLEGSILYGIGSPTDDLGNNGNIYAQLSPDSSGCADSITYGRSSNLSSITNSYSDGFHKIQGQWWTDRYEHSYTTYAINGLTAGKEYEVILKVKVKNLVSEYESSSELFGIAIQNGGSFTTLSEHVKNGEFAYYEDGSDKIYFQSLKPMTTKVQSYSFKFTAFSSTYILISPDSIVNDSSIPMDIEIAISDGTIGNYIEDVYYKVEGEWLLYDNDTKYVAGDNITITEVDGENVISATDTDAIEDLTDVELDNLSNGQILKYNLTTRKWENANESGGTPVVANPSGTATADLNKIQVDNTIYQIPQGGGGGGSSGGVYVEKQLYKATADSFTDISVAWNWEDYDFYIFAIHDTCLITSYKQSGDTSVLTYAQVKDLIDNNLEQYFYRANGKYDNYHFSNSTITATSRDGDFFITEIVGIKTSGDYYSPIIYSTEEREIGVWTDNKPLYEKTIYIGSLTRDSSWHPTAHGISNIEKVVEVYGQTKQSTDGRNYSIPHYRPSNNEGISVGADTTNVYYMDTWLEYASDTYVTVRYTKTTDVAGSGNYNTLGVPTVHYTTDEQVIGTWIDGKPLYKRVLPLVVTLSGNSWVQVSGLNSLNMDRCISVTIMNSNGNTTSSVQIDTYSSPNEVLYMRPSGSYTTSHFILEYTKTTDV